jgi:HK97 family phage prohead protease
VTNWLRAAVVRGAEAQDGEHSVFIASTDAVDRAGDIVEQDWHLEAYAANPVVLWAHRYDVAPVGRGTAVVEDGRLMLRVAWDTASATGAEVMRQVRQGFLSAVSVGFRPGESVPRRGLEDGDPRKGADGYVYRRNHLLEVSVVPVPANPQATVVSRAIGAELVAACVRKGLPAPGDAGEHVDAILRTAPDLVRARLVDDTGFVDAVAAKVLDAMEARRIARPVDPWAGWFPDAPAGPADQWAGWFSAEE